MVSTGGQSRTACRICARLARSIRPSILEALRAMRIPQGDDAQPFLCYIATMCKYDSVALASTATEEAQDMMLNILIAALASLR